MRIKPGIVTLCLSAMPVFALANPAAEGPPLKELSPAFLEWCKAQEEHCRNVTVAYRGAMASYTEKHAELPKICVPDPVAGDELTTNIIKRIESEPELQQLTGGEAIAEIVMQDYLCKK